MLRFTRIKQRKLEDFFDIYCDHREKCSQKNCTLLSTREMGEVADDDVGFVEHRKCTQFRGTDELGTLREAEIKEIGIWKPDA